MRPGTSRQRVVDNQLSIIQNALQVSVSATNMVKPGVLVASAFVIGLAWRGNYQAAVMVGLCTATLSLLVTMLEN